MSVEKGGGVPTPTTVELPYPSPSSTQAEPVLRRDGNVTYITKPEGDYTAIFGFHIASQNPDQLPENITGLVLETGGDDYTTVDTDRRRVQLQELKRLLQYNDLFLAAETKRLPIFLGELIYTPFGTPVGNNRLANSLAVLCSGAIPQVAEWTLGTKLFFGVAMAEKKLSRRSLLKATAAAYLVLPLGSQLIRDFVPVANGVSAEMVKATNRIHPENGLFVDALRVVAVAYKEQRFMEQMGNRQHLVSVWGRYHAQFETAVGDSLQDKYNFLQRFAPILKHIIVPETFYTFSEFSFDGISWELSKNYIMPELKALMD